jgi:mono/diheme cytochrome c family protein
MRKVALAVAVLLIAGCATEQTDREARVRARGRALAEAHCASCHAVLPTGDSPAPEAPPFRTLSRNYRVADLEEALAEGISVGHSVMPEFQFAPAEVNALVAYLQSIQETDNIAR